MTPTEMREKADRLEQEARALRKAAFEDRPLPDFWRVGQMVRYLRDQDYGPQKGDVLTIMELRDQGRPAREYQVFWTGEPGNASRWWTTPDDVELAKEARKG